MKFQNLILNFERTSPKNLNFFKVRGIITDAATDIWTHWILIETRTAQLLRSVFSRLGKVYLNAGSFKIL